MARKSSLHIKPTMSIPQVLLHYRRVYGLSYAVNTDHSVNDTKLYKPKKEIIGLFKKIQMDYVKHSYRGRVLPSNARPIREGVVNLKAHHTLADVEKMAKKIAKKMKVEILAISVHRDEGKDADNLNYHAHILFNYYNFNTHRTSHHFKEENIMPQVQDMVAEMLEMERGTPSNRGHIPHQQYREIAKMINEAKAPLITKVGQLKKEMENLRKQMIEANKARGENDKLYSKKDYQALAALKKKLNKRNFSEVVESYYTLYQTYTQMKKENKKLKDENGRFRRERTAEYQTAIDNAKQATRGISKTTERDYKDIETAYQAKQSIRADIKHAGAIAVKIGKFTKAVEFQALQTKNELLKREITALKSKPLQEPSLANALALVSAESGINRDSVFDVLNQKIVGAKRPDFIIDHNFIIDYEPHTLAMVRSEDGNKKSPISKATEHQKSVLNRDFDLITQKLASIIDNLYGLVSDVWKNYGKPSENENIENKAPTNTNTRIKPKRP